jgi:hypothetical protein
MARRKVDISKMMQAYEKENNGRIDAGFYDRLGEWAEANPLFDDLQIAPPGTEGRAGDGANGAVTSIVNPQTGERMILQGNQWVPAQ